LPWTFRFEDTLNNYESTANPRFLSFLNGVLPALLHLKNLGGEVTEPLKEQAAGGARAVSMPSDLTGSRENTLSKSAVKIFVTL